MNTALSWIKDYVPELDVSAERYTEAMTLTGTKVEEYQKLDKNLEKIVVGRIDSIEKHPNADKLQICQVDIGEDTFIQIVTGATNITVGDKVPVVLVGGSVAGGHDGTSLPTGMQIKKGKLRGVESFGMMCSIEEFGADRNLYPEAPENGIYIFPKDIKEGTDAIEVLGLHETVFEYEITSNRIDCFGVMGIAREVAATFQKEFIPPLVKETGNTEDIRKFLDVKVKDSKLCPRYVARMVKNIKIAPSPEWLQRRLRASGIRPINNIVDITNFVMEEYGQPMHAFDYQEIAGGKIVVERAMEGEVFTTLDGQERNLDTEVLMIRDAEKSIAIAGIMGGENSKITNEVCTMVFESANFNGTNIRLSSKRLGLRTDSSSKFEKGLDPENTVLAIQRACSLIEELGIGEVVGGMIDIYPKKRPIHIIALEPKKINYLLGTEISEIEMREYFQRLELKVISAMELEKDFKVKYTKDEIEVIGESDYYVVIPSFRPDLIYMADLAEEVARFFGYDKIPTTLPKGEATMGGISKKLELEEIARQTARFCGFSEAMNYSFESPKVFTKLLIPEDSHFRMAVEIANPLGEDFSIMRTLPLNGLLQSLSINYNHRNKNVKLFELANTYIPKALPLEKLPDEKMQFTLGFYGEGDFFTMKGVCEQFLDSVGLQDKISYSPECAYPFLHPGRKADMIYHGEKIGYLGEIHPKVMENYKLGEKTYIAVLSMSNIQKYAVSEIKYTGIARYPAITRDISLVVPKSVLAGQIEEIIEKKSGELLESYELFDIYEGNQIMSGFKSLAYSIVFRHKERTLTDKEINESMEKILSGLLDIGVKIRE